MTIARADVSRSSAYRRWPYKDLFLADLLVALARATDLSAEPPGLVEELLALIEAADLTSARARRTCSSRDSGSPRPRSSSVCPPRPAGRPIWHFRRLSPACRRGESATPPRRRSWTRSDASPPAAHTSTATSRP
ncbi:MAG: hypothetical protein CVT65_09125 [Actinobacteria bacterium HGW-Actinobacteria-5]|nr:MAG: hypothetical protein CVT65_09125 [Actinobacteria bacterium HGW-Actinobacteria-5]